MRKYGVMFAVFLTAILLSGCWDQRELGEITVVTGMAVDKGEDDKYTLTVEGINATELNNRTASGYAPSIVYSAEGNSLAELTYRVNEGMSRHLIYSHMRTLIIGEELAKEGIIDFIDFLERNREIRDDFNILIARGGKGSDVLRVTYQFQKSTSLKLHTQLDTMMKDWGGDPGVRMNDVITAWTAPGRQPVMAAVRIKGDPEAGASAENMMKVTPDALVVLDSLAIFKGDKLEGFLTLEDSRNYLWIQDKIVKTSITIECSENQYMGLRVYDTSTRIKGKLENGKAKINVKIRAEAYIDGTHCNDQFDKAKTYEESGKTAQKQINEMVTETIEKVQQEYGTDIFGFGEVVLRQDYQDFKKVQKNWDEKFADADINVDTTLIIRRTGIRTKSFLKEVK
ncbi:Ger(x)C family spore germination protein [Bacillus sp. CMF12]|uniref:Ger(x)C family spore germination protein n=1 Tax=Bacillaceae TaxID=186817 RepID=UPI001FB2122B|nr:MULTISPECIES: Ger(x)C family spore germination protein [Bacillaceae]UOE56339.1 Ger(x)C family spore germination protein [Cytobacillus oceanisediminis]USK50830.1 Ger(x)C family spore germination protein [Bacillus sp. CMF12]